MGLLGPSFSGACPEMITIPILLNRTPVSSAGSGAQPVLPAITRLMVWWPFHPHGAQRRLTIYIRTGLAKPGLTVNTAGNPSQIPCSVGRHYDASYAGRGRENALSSSGSVAGCSSASSVHTSITGDSMIFSWLVGDRRPPAENCSGSSALARVAGESSVPDTSAPGVRLPNLEQGCQRHRSLEPSTPHLGTKV